MQRSKFDISMFFGVLVVLEIKKPSALTRHVAKTSLPTSQNVL